MKPIALHEIASLDCYAPRRDAYRDAVIRHKRDRRIAVGEKVTLVFEDRETLRFQVQEMCWIERISEPHRVQAELDVYNELLPGDDELSATLFIEITDSPSIRSELDRLIGIDEHVTLALGDSEVRARFDAKQLEAERISAVQYLRFSLDAEQARRLGDPDCAATLRIDHPSYACEAPLPEPLRRSLCVDLAGGPAPLLALRTEDAVGHTEDEVLEETATLRVLRPARPRGPGHMVIEPRDPRATLLDADPALLAEILEAVRRAAADVVRDHGHCRVVTDAGPGADAPRWHVLAAGR